MSIAEKLRQRGLRPRKALGQNFLHDQRVCQAIAHATLPTPGAWVLEIGPGLGALTAPLLELAERVVALEKDSGLAAVLREEQADAIASGRLVLHEGDATRVDWLPLLEGAPGERVIAGNLPYSVTGLLLERATTVARHVARAVFMLQLEVAERLAAAPASEAYGALTVFVQAAFDVKRLLNVGSGAFFPRPEVGSAVVVLTPHLTPRAAETPAFRALVRAAFGQRRKTLRNAWRGLFDWTDAELAAAAAQAGIALEARGETLAVEDFARLAALAPSPSPRDGNS